MHGKYAHDKDVSCQVSQHDMLSCFRSAEDAYYMAIRALPEDLSTPLKVEGGVLPSLMVYQERIGVSARFRKNLAHFTGIVLPRDSAILEMKIIPLESLAHLKRTGFIPSLGNWSILMADEARRLSLWLLNVNARHFLAYARPGGFAGTAGKLESFKEFMRINEFRSDEVILASSIVLEMYGLRKANDIDYLAFGEEKFSMPGIEPQDGQKFYHCLSKQELITNPAWHFEVDGIRFVSFHQLKRFKNNRGSPHKDCHDVGMMEALESGRFVELWRHRGMSKLYSIFFRLRRVVCRTLRYIGFYSLARSIYRGFGGG